MINQLIEKKMREQTMKQRAKILDIKRRAMAIRRLYEKRKPEAFTFQTYAQGIIILKLIDFVWKKFIS